jgi:hypothetical protein
MSTKDINLDTLVSEVKKELEGLLKAEADVLAKAHPGEDTSDETPADESATASEASSPADAGPPADDASASAAPPPSGDGDADDAPPADASGSAPADASASGDPAADATTDHDALVAEYSKLDAETLKAHFLAAKEALMAALGADAAGAADGAPAAPPAPAADAGAPPPAAAAAPPMDAGSPPPDAPPALKGEMPADGNGENPLDAVRKAEATVKDAEIAALKKKVAEQDEALGKLVTAMKVVVEAPARKTVTSLTQIKKNEGVDVTSMSRDQVRAALRRKAEGKLSKSDRELINQFALNLITVEKVAHLLENK